MSFSDPRWLWALLGLPPLLLLEWRAVRRARAVLARLAGPNEHGALRAQRMPGQRRVGLLLRMGALAALVIGASGPEWGTELVRRSSVGSDLVFVLDVSASMDARDVTPSRLEEARREALAVLDRVQGSKVGVVAFSGDAVRMCPLTLDRSAARMVIEALSSGSVSEPGTDLGKALRAAARMMPGGRRTEQAVMLWTDGEDLEGGAQAAIDDMVRSGLRVFTIGCGTPSGDVVPVLDDDGRAVDVKRDENGGPVHSRLDEGLLRDLARRTRGAYFSAARPGGETARLVATLGTLARGTRGERLTERAVPRFPLCAAVATLLLVIDLARRHRRGVVRTVEHTPRRGDRRRRSRAAGAAVVAGFALLVAWAPRAGAQSAWARGDRAFREGRWAAAESLYAIRGRHGAPPEVSVDLALARARLGKRDSALSALRSVAQLPNGTGQAAGYNLGTLEAEGGDYDQALKDLRQSLERSPDDQDARFNYEWTLKQKRDQQRRSQDPKQRQQQQQQQQGPSQPGSGSKQPQSQPQQQSPQPSSQQQQPNGQTPQPGQQQQNPPPGGGKGMDRQQAERILASLQQLERLEQQHVRQVRVMREKRGRDW